MFKIGFGYDVHRLVRERDLILGGVKIPFEKGLSGYSDADVLSHAICDAILGACNLGDLGKHFPDTEKKYKGTSSLKLLSYIKDKIKKEKALIVNIDSTLVAEKPKLSPYTEKMRKNIAQALSIKANQISVKATTTEGLGFAGTGEGIACYAVVLVDQGNS